MLSIWQTSTTDTHTRHVKETFWKKFTWLHKPSCEIPQQTELGTNIENQALDNCPRSNKKPLTYFLSNVEKKGIMCNDNKHHKVRLLPLCNINLKQFESQIYKAEEKLIEFADIHINNI